MIVVSETCALC